MAYLIPDNAKSRPDIPNAARHVIGAFQVGLDETVTVWYEPLFDPSGGKPHLVLLIPDIGIIVLEVLDLKTSKILGVFGNKIRAIRDGEEIDFENPIARANNLAEILRERIRENSKLSRTDIPVGAGAVFPYQEESVIQAARIESYLPSERSIFRPQIEAAKEGIGEAGLLRCFRRILGRQAEEIPTTYADILRGIIQPDTVIESATSADKQLIIFRSSDEDEELYRVMDRHQESMAKSLGGGHRIIRGVAGSGKTLVLIYRAKLLSRLMPNDQILLTCYTRSLAGQLRSLLQEFRNIEVVNLDKLMFDLIRQARLRFPGYDNEAAIARIPQVAIDALAKIPNKRYDAVLVDEAQDFTTDALRFLVSLLKEGKEDLVIVADAAQNIFRRNFSWRQAGIQAQGRTRILRTNYRNTKEILEFASRFLLSDTNIDQDAVPELDDENSIIPAESANRRGLRPKIEIGSSVEDEVSRVVTRVFDWSKSTDQPKSLAILYGSSWENGFNRAQNLYDGLIEKGIDVFWLNNPRDRNAKNLVHETKSPVLLCTIHSAKGLEFPSVVLCGISRHDHDLESNRKLGYVGMTRATTRLLVVTHKGDPLAQDLEKTAA